MSRIFLLDPVCAQPEGHNLTLLRTYANFIRKNFEFDSVHLVVSKQMPTGHDDGLIKSFSFMYSDLLRVSTTPVGVDAGTLSFANKRQLAAVESAALFDDQALSYNDKILFPGADFYGASGILAALFSRKPDDGPEIILRFIGVLENVEGGNRSLFRLLRQVETGMKLGYRIKVTAETPLYTDQLASILETPCIPSPHPLSNDTPRPHPTGTKRIISLPGSGRMDKGFAEFSSIAAEFAKDDKYADVIFRLQNLPQRQQEQQLQDVLHLYSLPNVELLPPLLSLDEMRRLYNDSTLIMAPYAQDVYAMRGSAVLIEALDYGRFCISRADTAFARQIDYYGLGKSCKGTIDFVSAVKDFLEISPPQLDIMIAQAKYRYSADTNNAYSEIFR